MQPCYRISYKQLAFIHMLSLSSAAALRPSPPAHAMELFMPYMCAMLKTDNTMRKTTTRFWLARWLMPYYICRRDRRQYPMIWKMHQPVHKSRSACVEWICVCVCGVHAFAWIPCVILLGLHQIKQANNMQKPQQTESKINVEHVQDICLLCASELRYILCTGEHASLSLTQNAELQHLCSQAAVVVVLCVLVCVCARGRVSVWLSLTVALLHCIGWFITLLQLCTHGNYWLHRSPLCILWNRWPNNVRL